MSTEQEKQITLNEDNAINILQVFIEQAQRGKAIRELADAAKLYAALRFMQDKPIDPAFKYTTKMDALNACIQGVNAGQGAGVYSLAEANNALTVIIFLAAHFKDQQGEQLDEVELRAKNKGKLRAVAADDE